MNRRTDETRPARSKGREEALDHFVATVAKIDEVLGAIKAANDEHYGTHPDEVHWGHAGDAGRVLAGLKEVLDIIEGE
ncbi:hypothetical protein ACFL6M_04330 [Candidatus Eisenbacteria bacterium]|uniref:DUF86 domain-containing protein n=1 Tax=Eiseniibacteriota bacterium TaxID=2212470 RepID=A0ABV6YKD5_UNCEI